MCALLAVRGLGDPERSKAFLRPLIGGLHDPVQLADGPLACERLAQAIDRREMVLVHGDYDVDGISGTALLAGWIRKLGGQAETFVPHRKRDGYDLTASGVRRAAEVGARVLVTVDCGIRAHEWVEAATKAGVDVIVTDHHRPAATLPPAFAVVNPNRSDCVYPNKGLCGAGVAFKLCHLLARRFQVPDEDLWAQLDLVALATVADQVPLDDENRILVRFGLRALARTERPGVRALIERTGLRFPLDATSVAYGLAPRINAAGRIGETESALRMLMTEDPDEAEALAADLDRLNRERRKLDQGMLDEALDLLGASYQAGRDRGLVVANDGWHPGVIGIVASRIVERVFRPVVMVALDGELGRGSARSIPGFNLYDAISECAPHLQRYGGHAQAAGMDVRRGSLEAFREAFQEAAARRLEDSDLVPTLEADVELRLSEIRGDFFRYLRYVGPFGQGNPEPVLVSRRVHLDAPPKVVGRGHLKCRVVQDGAALEVIGFGLQNHVSLEALGTGPVDLAYTLSENTYRGRASLQGRALDIRPAA
ncbi:MAG: single-stranded-DNA-specific exonuclease RecJ [Gemmatimonadetes bacterium]|nr:single-stranded-DNA-specific exonuclease RecJ [Gemmatimonadota bacterium]